MGGTAAEKTEKMEVDGGAEKADVKTEEKKPVDPTEAAVTFVRDQLALLDRHPDGHMLLRILQAHHKTRRQLNDDAVRQLLAPVTQNKQFLTWLTAPGQQAMELDVVAPSAAAATTPTKQAKATSATGAKRALGVDAETYLCLLTLFRLVDSERWAEARDCAQLVVQRVDASDRRALDPLQAKAFYYEALANEKLGTIDTIITYLEQRLHIATLRKQVHSQSTLINLIIRCRFLERNYATVAQFIGQVNFPESSPNNEWARFYYYKARIEAIHQDFAAASKFFEKALLKAPTDGAIGFKQNVQKWVVVVNLLQGEIPPRALFRTPQYRTCLEPYFELAKVVRVGNVEGYEKLLDRFKQRFEADETLHAVVALRQNVIRTGLRTISLAYSRISIDDIGKKLGLSSAIETEYLVMNAIRDGVIAANIGQDSPTGVRYMQTNEAGDIYRTSEPQLAFDQRIKASLVLHAQTRRALRYPPTRQTPVETIEQQREREQQELDFAKEMAEEEDDDF